ncbi:hypothetical protein LR48_Vigan10g151900 [Vigna angularis]|uniref:Uncharacterized protein n=1 Tax=Phaseolus angularis TaxID=3914 RepID=A0A0L9VL54_PHAAN|nr:hypothetical protein LR48_Vigan10g151900 [Vigna angularis]
MIVVKSYTCLLLTDEQTIKNITPMQVGKHCVYGSIQIEIRNGKRYMIHLPLFYAIENHWFAMTTT